MSSERHPLVLPDLGVRGAIRASTWLVERGHNVTEGDRLLEVVVEGATVDLPAPVSGKLVELYVDEDQPISPGDVLAVLESERTQS